jgi:nucleoside-diphosphate-sugar epimerase
MAYSALNSILVTGATGNVGRNVVSLLSGTGARVRALTRNPQTADLPDSAEVVSGDLSESIQYSSCGAGLQRHSFPQ